MTDFEWPSDKTSISALYEYCAKTKQEPPEYEFDTCPSGGFECRVTFKNMEVFGKGRSKKQAKLYAAANMILMVRNQNVPPAVQDVPEECRGHDMVVTLRDYCVNRNHPLPIFEVVQQSGTADAPEFIVSCKVATIERLGVAKRKKDARQNAAYEMYQLVRSEDSWLDTMDISRRNADEAADTEALRYLKFKTYRELTECPTPKAPGVPLADRHEYFSKFYDNLQKAARDVMANTELNNEEKALRILEELKIKPKIRQINNITNENDPIIFIELDCMYDTVFAGTKDKIYSDIINYFDDMLA